MNKLCTLCCLLVILACEPKDTAPTMPLDIDNFDISKASLIKQGMLEGIGHTAMGTASLYEIDGKKVVVLDPYTSQNGPDLKVYLSQDEDASSYIRLGNLKAISGKQSYEVPGSPDISRYHYVHVWCEKYTVVFARAEVK
jgi:hypothetical protein